ncbi:MAG TPA: hypothetical protein VEZ15_17280, partial [Acidimicrobiia bacterium]|nr:hypothetical protein [Acidimicrobiia bacterium]
ARMRMRENGNWQIVARTTETVLERNGARGLQNPVWLPPEPVPESAAPRHDQHQAPGIGRLMQRAKRWTKRRASRMRHR